MKIRKEEKAPQSLLTLQRGHIQATTIYQTCDFVLKWYPSQLLERGLYWELRGYDCKCNIATKKNKTGYFQ